jgi:alkanesulfonate monooxygenase SsuD/methylene tetrahydromethanopterin reductase-like flavin-dependent oxidoreductase (luciferase family)
MDIGIGLPSTVSDVEGRLVVDWAGQAEARGFASVGTLDRLVYGNYEPLIALTAAAAVTQRVRLVTAVLLAPLRANAALLAKQAASVDRLSDGRLVLGLSVGGRQDDFEASGVEFKRRGRIFDAQLRELRAIWSGERRGFAGPIGPSPAQSGGPTLLIGGNSEGSLRRMVEYGRGWIAGGGGPQMFEAGAQRARDAWAQAGRPGQPRLAALAYFALGPRAREHAEAYLKDYYAFLGPMAERVAGGALVSEDMLRQALAAYQSAGCDELVLFPCAPELDQVDRLAQLR